MATIPAGVFYGKRKRGDESDNESEEADFDPSDSDEYIPSNDSTSSDSDEDIEDDNDVLEYAESPNEDEEHNIHSRSNNWGSVTGNTIKTFPFIDDARPPVITISNNTKPIDIYNTMVTNEVYQLLVKQTNSNANKKLSKLRISRRSRLKNWVDTNVSEIKQFLGIVMYMGIVKYPSIHMYWSREKFYRNDFVPKIMSRNRFQLLLRFIHFSDDDAIPNNRLNKVSQLLDMLERNFVAAKIPGEKLVVDESMIPWRGRLIFRQYNPGKSHKYGVKLYKLCDPHGYTYTSSIYCGKSDMATSRGRPTPGVPHSTKIVLDLAEPYLDKGRTVVTDNFYTSILLANELMNRQTHLLGTLRKNRVGNPSEVIAAKLKKNESIGRESAGIVVGKWMDKREVLMLSTKHDMSENYTGKKNRNNEEIKKLQMIIDYNKAKQGIDLSDQMASYFTPLRKTIRWYHKIGFEFLLNTAIVNSLVLYRDIKPNVKIVDFRKLICKCLCETSIAADNGAELLPGPSSRAHILQTHDTRDNRNRIIRKRCVECYRKTKNSDGRNTAIKTTKKISTFCNGCVDHPPLCLPCFTKIH